MIDQGELSASEAAKSLSALGAKKGGIARAKALTGQQRSEIARAAVSERWRKEGKLAEVAVATHGSPDSPLRIAGLEIPCYVLADGRRVLVQRGILSALDMKQGTAGRGGGDRLAKFIATKAVKPYVSAELAEMIKYPIRFQPPSGGGTAYGYEATLLADLCDAVLAARQGDKGLHYQQEHIAKQCEILVRGFARVGIIALVDEATGYQDDRARDALAKILEAFVATALRKWVRTFPSEFYKELFRLRRLPYNGTVKRPQYIGHLTNDLIYARLAPGVLEELHRVTPRDENGRLKTHLHRHLTEEIGHPKLLQHIVAITALMRACDNWDQFKKLADRAFRKQVPLPLFDGQDARDAQD
ncbi:MAG TPA: P63C domain-containing protein [Terriglobales bacterium]|nr:P63C domain-containing protein [Terriglobales bacterium]